MLYCNHGDSVVCHKQKYDRFSTIHQWKLISIYDGIIANMSYFPFGLWDYRGCQNQTEIWDNQGLFIYENEFKA